MRYCEIVPKNGSHYIVVDGVEWSRHDDVKIAEQVRAELMREFAERHDVESGIPNSTH